MKVGITQDGVCDEVVQTSIVKSRFILIFQQAKVIKLLDNYDTDRPTSRERIDVLAKIAGVPDTSATADTCTDKEWDRVVSVNLTAPTRLIRAVSPLMKAKKNGDLSQWCRSWCCVYHLAKLDFS